MKAIAINGKKISIRKAQVEDAEAIIQYLNIIGGESDFLTFGAEGFGRSIKGEEEFIETALGKKNALFLIAEVNGTVVANLNFSGGIRERTAHTGEFGVSVLKEYWGIGIGRELVLYLINWSKEQGAIRKINLRVRTDNTRGINLYKDLGFIEEGVFKRDFLINGEFFNSILMGLIID